MDPENICITWLPIGKPLYFSYLCRAQQGYREGDSAMRRPDAYFDQLQAVSWRKVTIKGAMALVVMGIIKECEDGFSKVFMIV